MIFFMNNNSLFITSTFTFICLALIIYLFMNYHHFKEILNSKRSKKYIFNCVYTFKSLVSTVSNYEIRNKKGDLLNCTVWNIEVNLE